MMGKGKDKKLKVERVHKESVASSQFIKINQNIITSIKPLIC